jgi:hypothetical protein
VQKFCKSFEMFTLFLTFFLTSCSRLLSKSEAACLFVFHGTLTDFFLVCCIFASGHVTS